MEHPNIDLIRAYSAALQAGDAAAALEYYADDLVLHIPGRSPHAGDHHGKDAVLGYYTTLFRVTEGNLEVLGVDDFLASDDGAATIVRWRLRRGDRVLDIHRFVLYRIADGKIAEIWLHDRDQYAYDEFFAGT